MMISKLYEKKLTPIRYPIQKFWQSKINGVWTFSAINFWFLSKTSHVNGAGLGAESGSIIELIARIVPNSRAPSNLFDGPPSHLSFGATVQRVSIGSAGRDGGTDTGLKSGSKPETSGIFTGTFR